MKNKASLRDCKCIHCKQKLNQINSSRLYWDKLILSKNVAQFVSGKLFKIKKNFEQVISKNLIINKKEDPLDSL